MKKYQVILFYTGSICLGSLLGYIAFILCLNK